MTYLADGFAVADTWPKHPDGRNKMVGEMEPAEKDRVLGPLLQQFRMQLAASGHVVEEREIARRLETGELELRPQADGAVVTYEFKADGYDQPILWNVEQALREVTAGHILKTVEVDRVEMEHIRAACAWDATRLPFVDPSVPGIGVPVNMPGFGLGYILIDGTHRTVRALQDGLPFFTHLLTDAAMSKELGLDPITGNLLN